MRRLLLAVLILALLAPASWPAVAQTGYLETFDLTTDHPDPWPSSPRLDVLVHSRDRTSWDGLEPMTIEHGPGCEAPPATHQSANPMPYPDAVFGCRDHLMTALNAGGYGLIYLTPPHLVDFSAGEAVVKFDMSTLRSSNRDWIDVWVTPFDDLMAAPLDVSWPDLQGPPKRGLHIRMDNASGGKTTFRTLRTENHVVTEVGSRVWMTYESVLTPSASRRDTFELRISKTHIKFWMPQYGLWWTDIDLTTPLGWDKGVVQFGHHSYNPTKDGGLPGTWHWDNLSISPTSPLTIIPANERRANPAQPTYTFAQPAPAGARLLLNAVSDSLEASYDDGATWETVTPQPDSRDHTGHMSTFWHPIPTGTDRVMLRGPGSWAGPWDANHAAIYAVAEQVPPTPTPVPPTPTPEPTSTPVPPTATPVPPTNTPTNTPTPEPTVTPVPPTAPPIPPTSTPIPPTNTPTPTSLPAGAMCGFTVDGVEVRRWPCQ